MSTYLSINVTPVTQRIGTFFVSKMTPKTLHAIVNKKLSRTQYPTSGIQRDIKGGKVKEIKKYIDQDDATFPNAIIIAIQNDPLDEEPTYRLNEERTTLDIKLQSGIANILDGQHRLSGFDPDNETFELPVSIFLDLSLGEQAKIFATINSKQTKVDLTLVYDLFGITDDRTPEKLAYHIVEHLNSDPSSAWRKKIKTLTERTGDLAQGSMAKLFHRELLERHPVFNRLYKEGEERDTDIKNILMNYFNAIAEAFPDQWANEDKKHILTKTTGFNGFMMFLMSLVKIAAKRKAPMSKDYFLDYIKRVEGSFEEFTVENYASGVKGQLKIRDLLREGLTQEEKEIAGIK